MNNLILQFSNIQKKCFKILIFISYILGLIIFINIFFKLNIILIFIIFNITFLMLYFLYFKSKLNQKILIEKNKIFHLYKNKKVKLGNLNDITSFAVCNNFLYVFNKEHEMFHFLYSNDSNISLLVNYLNKNVKKSIVNKNNLYLNLVFFTIFICNFIYLFIYYFKFILFNKISKPIFIYNIFIIILSFILTYFLITELFNNFKIIDNKIIFNKLFKREIYDIKNVNKIVINSFSKYGFKDYRVKFYIDNRCTCNFHLFNENIIPLKEICKKNSIKIKKK